ncbi:MAG: phenylalanine--tRNA ligase subunit alpha [archaeon]|nr:MAG: phenylalanine--tRNA ligase subunit alpha [archaeon]
MDKLLSLSPIERKILPFLELKNLKEIEEKSGLDETSIKRALQFLSNKKIITLKKTKKETLILDVNGIRYVKTGLPERNLLTLISTKPDLQFQEAKKQSGLSDNEFQAALGSLKDKGMIKIESGKLTFEKSKEELVNKFPEEKFLESLPKPLSQLKSQEKLIKELQKRRNLILVEKKEEVSYEITEEGKHLITKAKTFRQDLIEQLTPEIIKNKKWKGKKFRVYDIKTKTPSIFGGKRHPYLKFLEKVKDELSAIGFQEADGPIVEDSFFNCCSLFMPQNHPAKGIHDLYFIKGKADLRKHHNLLLKIKKTHENGWKTGSEGWKYKFSNEETSKLLLRSQGTAVSSRVMASKPKIPGKYYTISRVFRPDVIDSSHLTEFNQLDGIVIGDVNFRHLLGLLKLFAEKIAKTTKIRFVPAYFPFTEPSVELQAYFDGKWLELGGAGIFRPEVTEPFGIDKKVIAWGLGIDRLFMIERGIKDIRDIFSQDINFLRKS